MKRAFLAAALLIIGASSATAQQSERPYNPRVRMAMMCFSAGEQQAGFNKICLYDCMGSQVAITINAIQMCPMSINR